MTLVEDDSLSPSTRSSSRTRRGPSLLAFVFVALAELALVTRKGRSGEGRGIEQSIRPPVLRLLKLSVVSFLVSQAGQDLARLPRALLVPEKNEMRLSLT